MWQRTRWMSAASGCGASTPPDRGPGDPSRRAPSSSPPCSACSNADRGYPPAVRRGSTWTTFGCQMNAHDSERIKGMLEELGLGEAPNADDADVVVFNTCTIREKPDTKLAAYLGEAAARKREDPDRIVAIGAGFAEGRRRRLFELSPAVDVAFGPGSIAHLADWLGARRRRCVRVDASASMSSNFAASSLASRARSSRPGCRSRWGAIPSARTASSRGPRPRRAAARARWSPRWTRLAGEGVRILRCSARTSTRGAAILLPEIHNRFGELLRAVRAVAGIERIRFTSPHPKDFRDPGDRGDGRVCCRV